MTAFRAIVFTVLYTAWTAFLCLTLCWAALLPDRPMMALMRWYLGTVTFLERTVLGIDYQVVGTENLPSAPFLVAAKHQSAWETLKLPLLLDWPAIVLKEELLRIPIWGWFAKRIGGIAINRSGRGRTLAAMMRTAEERVAQKRPVVIFPQGTRVPPGQYASYKIGVYGVYQHLNLPVVPMAINAGVFWPRKLFERRPGTITVEFLEPIAPGLDRRPFMRTLEERLETASERLTVAVGGPPTERPSRDLESDGSAA